MDIVEVLWTLDELTSRVEAALAEGYDGAASGRVRDIPDRRTIRYYTTLGLIDRPAAMRGRAAFYGRRHLLQLVAIKKLQATGRTLAEIQTALAGRTDAELARITGRYVQKSDAAETTNSSQTSGEDSAADPSTSEAHRTGESPGMEAAEAQILGAIRLHPEVTLLIGGSRPITAEDVRAVRTAAVPLMDLLAGSRLIKAGECGEN